MMITEINLLHDRSKMFKAQHSGALIRRTAAARSPVCGEGGSHRAVAFGAPKPFRVGGLRVGGFTLIELLVVMGIIALLMALVAPAFTNIKSAGDVTNAAYTVKG